MRAADSLENGLVTCEGLDFFFSNPGVRLIQALLPARRSGLFGKPAPSSKSAAEYIRDEDLGENPFGPPLRLDRKIRHNRKKICVSKKTHRPGYHFVRIDALPAEHADN